MKRLATVLSVLAIPAALSGQVTPVGLDVALPAAPTVEAEDAAAAAAAEMVQTILAGEDDAPMWSALNDVLDDRASVETAGPAQEAEGTWASIWSVVVEWGNGAAGALTGQAPWTLEVGLVLAIMVLLSIALVSTAVALLRRLLQRAPSVAGRSARAPRALRLPSRPRRGRHTPSDAVRLAKRLNARRVG